MEALDELYFDFKMYYLNSFFNIMTYIAKLNL